MCLDSDLDFESASDVVDEVSEDISDAAEILEDWDDAIDSMSLDELYELRESLTCDDMAEIDGLCELQDTAEDDVVELAEVETFDPLADDVERPSYGFHWDGGPTHDTRLDGDSEPTAYARKLTR